ncbi:MAG TPA: sortase [Phototrophicaceae bacterium]|nr:sortase [Phototrophicaceae bacterium]
MYQRRLPIYARRERRPLQSLVSLLFLGMIIGGVFTLVERMRLPVGPSAAAPGAQILTPTIMPLAIPTVFKPDPLKILIPSAGIQANVVEVFLNGVSWDVSRLGNNAGHLQGTAAFGTRGNLVLAGHAEMADGRPGIFASLTNLTVGETLFLRQGSRQQSYTVSVVRAVEPNDLTVLYPTPDEQITLVTCGDYDFVQNVYHERVVVIANRAA